MKWKTVRQKTLKVKFEIHVKNLSKKASQKIWAM